MTNAKSMLKKVMGTVLAAAMTMSLSVSAFAATPETITVNFTDSTSGVAVELDAKTVSTQPLITAGTTFRGPVLEAILKNSGISSANFKMKFGEKATLLDVINDAAVQAEADPVYGATNSYDPNGIFVDSLFDMKTESKYGDYDAEGIPHSWYCNSWNIDYKQDGGAAYAAEYYANNEELENTPVTDITLNYKKDSMKW